MFKKICPTVRKCNTLQTRCLNIIAKERMKCEEIKINVPWGHVSGKWWGPQDTRPVLCVHGWQDNCGTFDRLIPLLSDHTSYLAIDLPGHGKSSHLPSGSYYHENDMTIFFRRLQKYMDWPKISMLAHSMGSIMSLMYTSYYPESVEMLACIDLYKPIGVKPVKEIEMFAETVDRFLDYEKIMNSGGPPSYTYDESKKIYHDGLNGSVDFDKCDYILNRALTRTSDDRFCFSRDIRLKAGLLYYFSHQKTLEHVKRINCPLLILKASHGYKLESKEIDESYLNELRNNKYFQCYTVQGTHHVHLNNPELISDYLNKFIHQHHRKDDIHYGMRQEMKISRKL